MQLQIHKLHEAIVEPLIMKVLKNDIFFFITFCDILSRKKKYFVAKVYLTTKVSLINS